MKPIISLPKISRAVLRNMIVMGCCDLDCESICFVGYGNHIFISCNNLWVRCALAEALWRLFVADQSITCEHIVFTLYSLFSSKICL